VPGHPMDARAAGCNMLIRDGAVLVRSAADVLEILPEQDRQKDNAPAPVKPTSGSTSAPPSRATQPRENTGSIAKLHARILSRLGPAPIAEDQLIRDLQVPSTAVAPALLDLEMDGQIERQPGGLLSRTA
jgi:DNA processing protein